ncbi:MAG TPA: AAA family ATPase [Verrucomicrobiae bacterium]|nr:AAA family ATPase [Verrucomicrobiae bacterium]
MSFPILVISGHPATGKTFLGKKIATELAIPMVSKDGLKEILFDTLGWSDREWSKKLGMASMRLLDSILLAHLEAKQPLIIESNFKPEFENERFRGYAETYGAEFIQILCWANGDVLSKRFHERVASGERHPGHVDGQNPDEFKKILEEGKSATLDIPGKVIEVDTTDFAQVDYAGLIQQVRKEIGS